jgi:hypothetical protein
MTFVIRTFGYETPSTYCLWRRSIDVVMECQMPVMTCHQSQRVPSPLRATQHTESSLRPLTPPPSSPLILTSTDIAELLVHASPVAIPNNSTSAESNNTTVCTNQSHINLRSKSPFLRLINSSKRINTYSRTLTSISIGIQDIPITLTSSALEPSIHKPI